MEYRIITITLQMPFHMGWVNTYLIETASGFLLIDTGGRSAREEMLEKLESNGCSRNNLKLILLTHGDFDHIGNAAILRSTFASRIAMGSADRGMAEKGDMFINRKKPNPVIRLLLPLFSGFAKNDRFTPDVEVGDGYSLCDLGLDAKVISLPGHSKGSIGILTTDGDLFCGDLFENIKAPTLNSLMDDPASATGSLARLKDLKVKMAFPGHGQPFALETLLNSLPGAV